MTEDYELGVRLGVHGLDAALVRIPADDADTRIVATREYFPATLEAAVRQRARWLLGITLAGWQRLGWPGTLVDRYMLLRDRKALLNAYLNIAAYVAARLAATGVTRIAIGGQDTYAEAEDYFSYRRACHKGENSYGRQLSVIGLN